MFLCGIGIKTVKKEPLQGANSALVTLEEGIVGDARGAGGRERRRQITVISHPQWEEACRAMGWRWSEHSWMLRRANLCIRGGSFVPAHIGGFILIGPEVVLEVTGETTPCERMDAIAPGLKDALAPSMRGGVTCRVIRGGKIAVPHDVHIHDHYPL